MNSVLGVPYSDYAILVRASQICVCCKNHFSPDAYNDHQREGKCTNHPQLLAIDEIEAFNKDSIRLRSFRDGKRPVSRGETLDCAVAAVLLEWNSRLGVPADVSFPAHALHLDNAGACTDPGQALVPADAATPRSAIKCVATPRLFSAMANTFLSRLPVNPALFDAEASGIQRRSVEIVLYSPFFRVQARIGWPTVGGNRLPPQHILPYLQKEGLHWSCFCSMTSDAYPFSTDNTALSCRLLTWRSSNITLAVCHYEKARCQFFRTSTLTQAYVPMGQGVAQPDSNLARFLSVNADDDDNLPQDFLSEAIYLPGYLGEPGQQLGKQIEGTAASFLLKYYAYNNVANHNSVGVQADTPSDLADFDARETDILLSLAKGEAVPSSTMDTFIGACTGCGGQFLKRLVPSVCTYSPRRRTLRRPANHDDAEKLDRKRANLKAMGVEIL
ncbi:hypothetical protein C8R47DRAFT_1255833 [Mycena vitilis]|nr:hypothetical protein C8R47DRAFT_1255833 [Mycena vitilis]